MSETFNIYCDKSCHLENDGQKAMALGAVWCPKAKRLEIGQTTNRWLTKGARGLSMISTSRS